MKRKSFREKLETRCQYFNGVQHDECDNHVIYKDIAPKGFKDLPCTTAEGNACQFYKPLSKEEIDKEIADMERTNDLILKNLSPCCEAEIDQSQVIKDGSHKGHGPRYCSKCKKFVYIV